MFPGLMFLLQFPCNWLIDINSELNSVKLKSPSHWPMFFNHLQSHFVASFSTSIIFNPILLAHFLTQILLFFYQPWSWFVICLGYPTGMMFWVFSIPIMFNRVQSQFFVGLFSYLNPPLFLDQKPPLSPSIIWPRSWPLPPFEGPGHWLRICVFRGETGDSRRKMTEKGGLLQENHDPHNAPINDD